jgi:hypothetical protein
LKNICFSFRPPAFGGGNIQARSLIAAFFFTCTPKHWLSLEKQVVCFFQSRENSKKYFTSVC